jgi:hypothetical protein
VSGQRKALIVANDEYEQEGLRNLLAPAADAEALGRVLGDPRIGEFDVQVIRNEPSHVIQEYIEDLFSESRPDDVLLLHFSGHGLKSESGELFFASSNTRPNRLGSTAVAAAFVQRCMRDSRSRGIVLLLDCCYGGAFAQGVTVRASGDVNVLDSFPQERPGAGRGRAVITASSAMEYAFEGDQLADDQQRRPSVFTAALVEGLATGEADRDEDGWVSLDELYDYVFDKVREQNPHQTPGRQVELEGELYLARSRRRRIRIPAAPIPADLQTAMTDPNMYARLGAVSELRSRLASDDLPAAEAAREALAELARTDVRYVADPAAAALAEAAVQPAETELHFGLVEQGSPLPHRTVQLLGPPIARACVPRPSHDWILVDQTTSGLDISIDTTGTGTRRGSVDLNGPAGAAVIAIDADLVAPPPQAAEEPAAPARGTRFGLARTAREVLENRAAGDSRAAATKAAPAGLTDTAGGTTSRAKRPPAPARGATLGAETRAAPAGVTSPGVYPAIDKRFWHLAAYLLPIVLGLSIVLWLPALLLMMFKRDRLIRMNAIQSLLIDLIGALAVTFGSLADWQAGYVSAGYSNSWFVFYLVLAGVSGVFFASLLLYCVIKIIKHEQPRIRVLTKVAHRLAYGGRQA